MKIIEIKSKYGVVYNSSKEIVSLKTPENTVYPSKDSKVFECETNEELQVFITKNELIEKEKRNEYSTKDYR